MREASGLFFGMERGLVSGRSDSISLNLDLSSFSPVSLVTLKVLPLPRFAFGSLGSSNILVICHLNPHCPVRPHPQQGVAYLEGRVEVPR